MEDSSIPSNIMKKGFTLIELLVVIAILAVLATAVVLVLNPAELLKQGRDSTRVSDMAALNGAVSLWVADVLNASGNWTAVSNCTATTTKPGGATGCTYASSTVTTGSGWVNLNFNLIAAGSPLSKLPLDPNNGSTNCSFTSPAMCQYAWSASSTVGGYELNASMESVKFNRGGTGDVTSKDGGTTTTIYEVGSALSQF
jgi:prepilin-type N-terminal cleavage/methylation domain-containing protein